MVWPIDKSEIKLLHFLYLYHFVMDEFISHGDDMDCIHTWSLSNPDSPFWKVEVMLPVPPLENLACYLFYIFLFYFGLKSPTKLVLFSCKKIVTSSCLLGQLRPLMFQLYILAMGGPFHFAFHHHASPVTLVKNQKHFGSWLPYWDCCGYCIV